MNGPDQLELFLTPEDDGTFHAFIRLMADPEHNPQLRKDDPDAPEHVSAPLPADQAERFVRRP